MVIVLVNCLGDTFGKNLDQLSWKFLQDIVKEFQSDLTSLENFALFVHEV